MAMVNKFINRFKPAFRSLKNNKPSPYRQASTELYFFHTSIKIHSVVHLVFNEINGNANSIGNDNMAMVNQIGSKFFRTLPNTSMFSFNQKKIK